MLVNQFIFNVLAETEIASYEMYRSSHQSCSIKKDVPKNFTKFTIEHLWKSLFLNEVVGLRLRKTFFTEHLQRTDSVYGSCQLFNSCGTHASHEFLTLLNLY